MSAIRLSKQLASSSAVALFNRRTYPRASSCKMSTDPSSTSLAASISLPTQLGQPVQIVAAPGLSDSEFRSAIESSLFKLWLKNLQSANGILASGELTLTRVLIQSVDMFGKRLGFLKFKADIIDKETGKKQVRVPTGRVVLELPAGMLDDDKGDFVGAAVREVEEETGINLDLEDVIDLTSFLDPSTGCRVFPSPGGCDEEIRIFLYRGNVEKKIIMDLQGKEAGLREHGELIKVHAVPYKQLWRMTADAKVLMAIALYENAKQNGLLPPR